MSKELIKVRTCVVDDVFNSEGKIALPDYQRPYTWNEENILQLFEDIETQKTNLCSNG